MDQMKCPESSQQTDEAGAAERQRRVTITIIRLMCLFLICWTPFFIMLPVDSLCDCVQDSTWQWCTWLGYTNSALNPVVYAAAATRVRRAFQALLKSVKYKAQSYVFFSVTFSFYVPTCIMLVQYGLIVRALALRSPIRAHRGQNGTIGSIGDDLQYPVVAASDAI
ncbi:alpha-2A adrenergic receptor-like [Cydia strobilella]|uniref:alpha-2A adrenergic receptor-like n=1 Tax=Cydia strobilella TaxID=1100964 RepID=UPI003004217C